LIKKDTTAPIILLNSYTLLQDVSLGLQFFLLVPKVENWRRTEIAQLRTLGIVHNNYAHTRESQNIETFLLKPFMFRVVIP
jgi:hypothetical protein